MCCSRTENGCGHPGQQPRLLFRTPFMFILFSIWTKTSQVCRTLSFIMLSLFSNSAHSRLLRKAVMTFLWPWAYCRGQWESGARSPAFPGSYETWLFLTGPCLTMLWEKQKWILSYLPGTERGSDKIGKVNSSEVAACWGLFCSEMTNCDLHGDGTVGERSVSHHRWDRTDDGHAWNCSHTSGTRSLVKSEGLMRVEKNLYSDSSKMECLAIYDQYSCHLTKKVCLCLKIISW